MTTLLISLAKALPAHSSSSAKGVRVEASHYGRNEQPNTGEGGIIDKARALLITIGAYLGLSDMQWSNLIKGLLA